MLLSAYFNGMFDLTPYMSERQLRVEKFLEAIMPPESVEPVGLHKAMRYMTFSSGKRIRPVLCLAACELAGGNMESALYPAAAVELFHTYTLVHDDLPSMDNDDFRRGKPACHKAFDEATAVLTGDALQTMAFELLARTPDQGNSVQNLVLELAVSGGSVGVAGGQAEEIALQGRKPGRPVLERIHYRKTALLLRAAVRLGAITGNASPAMLEALTLYGTSLGLAFQITDDILDAVQDHSVTAKGQGSDNMTCLAIMTLDAAAALAKSHTQAAIDAIGSLPSAGTAPLTAIAHLVEDRIKVK
jgi:geranylgeranyl pyrophosphate synthase